MSNTYTTISGDTWDWIAYTQLGGSRYANDLMKANSQYIDMAIFSAGEILTLPTITTTKPASLPPWKK